MNKAEEFRNVSELRPGLKGLNLKVKCLSKNEEREVVSKNTGDNLRLNEALIGDVSGSILLTLWNDDIEKVQPEHVYKLNNSYTTVFKGSLRLNIGRNGTVEELPEEVEGFPEVDEVNNLSDKIYEERQSFRSYGGYGNSRSFSRNYDQKNDTGRNNRRKY